MDNQVNPTPEAPVLPQGPITDQELQEISTAITALADRYNAVVLPVLRITTSGIVPGIDVERKGTPPAQNTPAAPAPETPPPGPSPEEVAAMQSTAAPDGAPALNDTPDVSAVVVDQEAIDANPLSPQNQPSDLPEAAAAPAPEPNES